MAAPPEAAAGAYPHLDALAAVGGDVHELRPAGPGAAQQAAAGGASGGGAAAATAAAAPAQPRGPQVHHAPMRNRSRLWSAMSFGDMDSLQVRRWWWWPGDGAAVLC